MMSDIFEQSGFVIQKTQGNKVILVNLSGEDESVYEIDGLSLLLWQRFNGIHSLGTIIEEVILAAKIPLEYHQRFKTDSQEFVEKLLGKKLLQKKVKL
jgi:hypothetical protein